MTERKAHPAKRGRKPGVKVGDYKAAQKAEALALVRGGMDPQEAAEEMKRRGKPVGKTALYEALQAPTATEKTTPEPPAAKPDKPAHVPIVAEKPPEGLSLRVKRVWYVEKDIALFRDALATAEAELKTGNLGALTRMAALSGRLQALREELERLAPPEPPDPHAEERKWKASADAAVAKIKAGVKDARERMAALMGRPFPGGAVGAGG